MILDYVILNLVMQCYWVTYVTQIRARERAHGRIRTMEPMRNAARAPVAN